jgi:histone H3/H4
MLINKSQVKESTEMQVSEEFYVELDKKVEEDIKKAEERARENGRRTLYKRDL